MRFISRRILVFVVALGLLSGLCGATRVLSHCVAFAASNSPRASSSAMADSLKSTGWTSFEWSGGAIKGKGFDRAAILVPIKLESSPKTLWMQLDTGSNMSTVYEIPLRQLRSPSHVVEEDENFVALRGAIGNYPFDSLQVFLYREYGESLDNKERPVIGTIGLDLLSGKVLVLDFPNRRFLLTDSLNSSLEDFISGASFVNVELRNGRVFVPLEIAGVSYRGFFYDSGASLFPITTSKEIWRKITGRSGTEKSNARVKAPSWGKEAILIGAPVRGSLKFGSLRVENPMVYFDSTGLIAFPDPYSKSEGLIGNALFYDEYTLILDLKQKRLGIVKSE